MYLPISFGSFRLVQKLSIEFWCRPITPENEVPCHRQSVLQCVLFESQDFMTVNVGLLLNPSVTCELLREQSPDICKGLIGNW